MIALDTNILVYAHRSQAFEHKAICSALKNLFSGMNEWGIPLPCVAEFWSIVTHPSISNRPSTTSEASQFLDNILENGHGAIFYPQDDFYQRLTAHAHKLKVYGNRIFDLQIALTAADNGATAIWTCDQHFTCIPGLKILNPTQMS